MALIFSNPRGGITRGTVTSDLIVGSDADDTIYADAGEDAVFAGKGDDKILAGAGADQIDGGEGNDTLIFADAAPVSNLYGVSVDLYNGVGHWGDAEGDTYVNIENVIGSHYNDAIRGNNGSNILFGEEGNDTIIGGAGGDRLDGGKGIDTLSYRYWTTPDGAAPQQSAGVTVNLTTNVAYGGDAEGDIISGFENVDGSAGADTLTGSSVRNIIHGYEKNDTIFGMAGDDQLEGDGGNDTIDGGRDNDMIIGGDGNDTMKGGQGADQFVFNIVDSQLIGNDRIVDFEIGVDQLWFNVGVFGNVTQAEGLHELNITHSGADTIITYDDVPGSLTLVGIGKEDMPDLIDSMLFY